jgi:DNA-binding transcriptional regulator YdaS (Cro superfamily)
MHLIKSQFGRKPLNPQDLSPAKIKARNKVRRIVDAAGGPTMVAKSFAITQQAVNGWMENGSVPSTRVAKLAKLTEGKYAPHQIRPDVFPKVVG